MQEQNNPYNGYQAYQRMPDTDRSPHFEVLALIFGIITVVTCACLYISLISGALAIMFALLSRGGRMSLTSRAQAGLILGIIGLVLTAILYGASFYTVFHEYGSLENALKAYSKITGLDYNELMNQLMGQ